MSYVIGQAVVHHAPRDHRREATVVRLYECCGVPCAVIKLKDGDTRRVTCDSLDRKPPAAKGGVIYLQPLRPA